MDKIINADSLLEDIRSNKARNSFDDMVNYMCAKPIPNELGERMQLNGTLEQNHNLLANLLYSKENCDLANYILNNRSMISDYDAVNGYSWIYELDREILLELDSRKFFASVGALEHELIHLILAINHNNPKPQYVEMLSFFGEILSLEILSKKHNNPDVYKDEIIRRFISRVSRRVYTYQFEDDFFKKQSEFFKKCYVSFYTYMLGFIFAIRLLDLYHSFPQKIIETFNSVLSGKQSVDSLLEDYHISLEDDATIESFKNMCDLYERFVNERYNELDLHYVR